MAADCTDELTCQETDRCRRVGIMLPILARAGLPEQVRYFENHKRRMRYQHFRADGFPIGSGTVESACKQYKARVTGPGMRWSRHGAERMLVIRSAIMCDAFDDLWAAA